MEKPKRGNLNCPNLSLNLFSLSTSSVSSLLPLLSLYLLALWLTSDNASVVEPNKQISCPVYLFNKTNNDVAFKVKLTKQKKYYVWPNARVILPGSSFRILVIIRAQKDAPADLQCNDKFLFQCVVCENRTLNITPGMFCKETTHQVYETKLGVRYVAPPIPAVSEDDFGGSVIEPKACDFSELYTVFRKTLLSCSSSPLLLSYLLCFPMYHSHLLRSNRAQASSDSSSIAYVSYNENYSHLFNMPLASLTTKGISPPQYQVFINFRGDELRNTFVGFLAKAMRLEKINVFIDEVEVRGTTLNSLFSRIEESKVAVTILSERYTESSWCLDELVKMIEQMEQGKLVVVPVFYKLDPIACANLDGAFGEKFRKLAWEYRSEPGRIEKWKKALSSIFKIMGLKLDTGSDESKFVDLLVEQVKKVLIKIFTEDEKTETSTIRTSKTFEGERRKFSYGPLILSRA